jgi:hypothetical protein
LGRARQPTFVFLGLSKAVILNKIKMMSSVSSLKKDIISRIRASDDIDFLSAIKTILSKKEEDVFKLSQEQIEAIEAGMADVEAGRTIPHEEVMANIKSWLNEK